MNLNSLHKRFLFSILFSLIFSNISFAQLSNKSICTDRDKFCFQLSFEQIDLPELFDKLYVINKNLIYLTGLNVASNKTLFSVSKYVNQKDISFDSAFSMTVNYVPKVGSFNNSDYHLLDFGKYKVNGKELRYKISNPLENEISIMYYFMKGNSSKEMYEIKATCNRETQKQCKQFMENVALSVVLH